MSQSSDMLAKYIAAEQAVLSGQSYGWGDRNLTLANLAEIRSGRREWQAKVDAEAAASAGRGGPRHSLANFSGGIE